EFWKEVAEGFFWKSPPKGEFLKYNFDVTKGNVNVKFMEGAKTNICYNILDRNVKEKNRGEKVAYYWEGNSPSHSCSITYSQLLKQVCKFANVLKNMGKIIDYNWNLIMGRVVLMAPCNKFLFIYFLFLGSFSSESLCERILDSQCSFLITADGVYRGDKLINLKQISDEAMEKCKEKENFVVKNCIIVRHIGKRKNNANVYNTFQVQICVGTVFITSLKAKWVLLIRILTHLLHHWQTPWNADTNVWWDDVMKNSSEECEPEWVDAEDPLFILYTSGSTVLHTVAGYLLYTALTFKYVFDYHPDDVYWCTADIGWITGHSYITYGPLANGATSVLFEGVPVYPHVGRFWEIIEKHSVSKFYTAPTAIRLLMKYGQEPVKKFNLGSLKILGTVGEPINPEAWLWYYNVVGEKRCPVLDTFWQTETGGHVITPLPAATPLKPGSATFPFFGVLPIILNEHGEELEGEAEGYLVFKQPWPAIMRTVYGNHERFENTYFKKFPGFYVTGDGCRRDKEGYYWITGRIDDMLNVSGHLLSTAEVESALTEHPVVAEAAVVSCPHAVKGECLYCFVTLKNGREFSHSLAEELKKQVREKIGPIATPDFIQNAPGLPKTRSGKIMRRVLRQIARSEKDLGDLSTLADPKVVEVLFSQRCEATA
ncbi:ACSA protein, partial [Polyodon spathula]|nr:ACSA protein [Polyodon spathula]